MRSAFALASLLLALDAWEKHQSDWLESLKVAKAPRPTEEALKNYRACWIEGFLECAAGSEERK